MPQSLTQLYSHTIFTTKNRHPFINQNIKFQLYYYIIGILNSHNSPPMAIGGTEDHIHILHRLSKKHPPCKTIEKSKTQSSHWMKSKGIINFYWQGGYGSFSVSPERIQIIKNYIINQEEHHKKESFREEYKKILKQYNIPINEKYLWD